MDFDQPPAPELLVATGNPHKVREISQILRQELDLARLALASAADYPDVTPPTEDGDTFEANALAKARAYARTTGRLTLADDSGLMVDHLQGRPGLQSARYAPSNAERIQRVLAQMREAPRDRRSARFICCVALVDADGQWMTARGTLEGRITTRPRGCEGFGYDPIFELIEPPWTGRTAAELDAAQKNRISHRARAVRAIADRIRDALAHGAIV